ncbi:MAG: zf-HC2 domain-containing protein [Pseudomonadota bacterium]
MTCSEFVHRLDAFVDGETSPDESREIEEHLQRCDACRARVDELHGLTNVVRDELKRERAPADLWPRIEAKLPQGVDSHAVLPLPWWRRRMRPLALAASVVLLIGIAAGVGWWRPSSDYDVVTAPVQDFTTYRLSGRDVDVESTDPGVVQAWFEEKLAFELPPIKARIAGFNLVGGRLCWFLERRIGALAYQRGDQVVSVYVMADYNLTLPEATFEPALAISRSVHEVDDVSSMIWHDGGLVYSVVSDLKAADLAIFLAALARGERQAAGAITDATGMAKTST